MQIGTLGAGNVGSALVLARAWSRAGHSILLGLRDPARYSALLVDPGATALPLAATGALADVVVLALAWAAAAAAASGFGDLIGKIVIDAMNPITRSSTGPN